jgi:hypothetical protein
MKSDSYLIVNLITKKTNLAVLVYINKNGQLKIQKKKYSELEIHIKASLMFITCPTEFTDELFHRNL